MPSPQELIVILVILMLLFGATRLPKLARSIGQSATEFKTGLKEGFKEETVGGACPFCKAEVPSDAKFCPSCGKSADDIKAEKAKQKSESA
jgi:TatA/E family protein of Tat protein translocase